MSYSYSFVPNNIYGANALNEITRRLVTSGVEDAFENDVPYNFNHINTISKNITGLGVIPENNTSLKVTDNGKADDEYTITIADGTAFFEDGSTITIYDGGETLPYAYGQKNYVYVVRDLNLNQNMPKVTLTEPEGDFVPLAEISETGVITDTRTFAKGKLPGYMSDYNMSKKIEVTMTDGYAEIDLGGTNYKVFTILIYNSAQKDYVKTLIHLADGKLVFNIAHNAGEYRVSYGGIIFSYSSLGSTIYGSVQSDGSILKLSTDNGGTYYMDVYAS